MRGQNEKKAKWIVEWQEEAYS